MLAILILVRIISQYVQRKATRLLDILPLMSRRLYHWLHSGPPPLFQRRSIQSGAHSSQDAYPCGALLGMALHISRMHRGKFGVITFGIVLLSIVAAVEEGVNRLLELVGERKR